MNKNTKEFHNSITNNNKLYVNDLQNKYIVKYSPINQHYFLNNN